MSPQRVRAVEFRVVRKGLDPDEVRSFLDEVADELEHAQNQTTAMEARARAALARLQEAESGAATTPSDDDKDISADQADAISKTLLLAQRTADATIADARSEAERIVAAAREEADATIESTRELSSQLVNDARDEARRAGEAQRVEVASEVDALVARRAFLLDDVSHLEQFVADQRSRVRDAASELLAIADRVPAGLGAAHPPVVSAAGEAHDPVDQTERAPADDVATHPDVVIPVEAGADDLDDLDDLGDLGDLDDVDDVEGSETAGDEGNEVAGPDDATPSAGTGADSGGLSFRFDED